MYIHFNIVVFTFQYAVFLSVTFSCKILDKEGDVLDITGRLYELLKQRGWTRYKLAKESGVPESTLTNIFYRGTTPTIATLEDICKALNITLSQFFAENEMVEMTEDLKELYNAWIKLTPEKRKNILETMKMMK